MQLLYPYIQNRRRQNSLKRSLRLNVNMFRMGTVVGERRGRNRTRVFHRKIVKMRTKMVPRVKEVY